MMREDCIFRLKNRYWSFNLTGLQQSANSTTIQMAAAVTMGVENFPAQLLPHFTHCHNRQVQ